MSLFSDNIKFLRGKKKVTQQLVANAVEVPRPRYAKYEDGRNFPPSETLLSISRYFELSIDLLLSTDVQKIPLGELLKIENNRVILPILVDNKGRNIIEIVDEKAKAGYLAGYSDPQYIENLEQISLPFLGTGKHRGFPVDGDSMPPHEKGTIIVCKYVERLGDVTEGKTYVLITKSEGIVYKRLNKKKKNSLMVESDNLFYPNYEIRLLDILEIWEYKCSIGKSDKKQINEEKSLENIIKDIHKEMREIKQKIGLQN